MPQTQHQAQPPAASPPYVAAPKPPPANLIPAPGFGHRPPTDPGPAPQQNQQGTHQTPRPYLFQQHAPQYEHYEYDRRAQQPAPRTGRASKKRSSERPAQFPIARTSPICTLSSPRRSTSEPICAAHSADAARGTALAPQRDRARLPTGTAPSNRAGPPLPTPTQPPTTYAPASLSPTQPNYGPTARPGFSQHIHSGPAPTTNGNRRPRPRGRGSYDAEDF